MQTTPTVATFPRDDAAFASFVRTTLAGLNGESRDPAVLQARLRRWHSRAIVQPQDDLAGFGDDTRWYVYRDGRAGVVSEEGWWLADDAARVEFGHDGTFSSANAAADELIGIEGGLVGHHWSDLLAPAARSEDGAWLWTILDAGDVAQSVFDLPLPDGRRKVIEYRSSRAPDGDRYQSVWRELAVIDVGDE